MKAYAAVMYGMGGPVAEWWNNGERELVERLKKLGVETGASPYMDYDREPIYNFLSRYDGGIRIVGGDSLGACNAPLYAGDLKTKVSYIFGFQPSLYGTGVNGGVIRVPDNVVRGHCIWDPVFADTSGLGAAHWQERTGIIVTAHRGAHPDDWPVAQDWIVADIQRLVS